MQVYPASGIMAKKNKCSKMKGAPHESMDIQKSTAPGGPAADVAQTLKKLLLTLTEEECRDLLKAVDFLKKM